MNGLILGRSPVLWYGFGMALLNLAVVAGLLPLDTPTVAAADAVLALGLALLANSSDPRTVPTFAPTITPPAPTIPIPTPGTTAPPPSSSGMTGSPSSDPTAGGSTDPAGPTGGAAEGPSS